MAIIGHLFRYSYSAERTRGVLVVGDKLFHTLELPWRNNQRNVSCIPTNEYLTKYLPKSGSGRFDKTYHLQAVPNRTGILIHTGNITAHTNGCILIGRKPGRLAGKAAILESVIAMTMLRSILGKEPFTLQVTDYERID